MKNTTNPKEPFKEQKKPTIMPVMLALFDVLGFSRRMADKKIDAMFSTYQKLISDVIIKEPMRCIGAHDMGDGTKCPTLFSADIRYTYFSDTILLWMPLEKMFAGPFVQRCTDLVCEALSMKIPLRGAISLGEAVMHKSTGMYLGEPIIEAHKLEAAQDWTGVAFAPSGTWSPFVAELSPTQIIEYEIPVKAGKQSLKSPIALDWPRRWRETRNDSLVEILENLNTSPKHKKYYENAIAFTKFSEHHHDWHKKSNKENQFKFLRMVEQKQ